MSNVHYLRPDILLAQAEAAALKLYGDADDSGPLQRVIFACIRTGRHDRALRLLNQIATDDRGIFWDFHYAKLLSASGDLLNARTMAMKLLPMARARLIGEIAWRYADRGDGARADRTFQLAFELAAQLDDQDKRDDLRAELMTLLAYCRPETIREPFPVAVEDPEDLLALRQAAVRADVPESLRAGRDFIKLFLFDHSQN